MDPIQQALVEVTYWAEIVVTFGGDPALAGATVENMLTNSMAIMISNRYFLFPNITNTVQISLLYI